MSCCVRGHFTAMSLAACLLLAATAVQAQAPACPQQRKVGSQALDEATWQQLNGAYADVGQENYDQAYARLQQMLGRAGGDSYLQAILYQALAQVEWSRENFDPALDYFEQAVALDVLPDQAHFALMYQIAQLYTMKERYRDALERLELWFCSAPQARTTAAAFVLKASIHASLADYPSALAAIEQAMALQTAPEEPWYQLKLAAHYELAQYPQAAQTLATMVTRWPQQKTYWVQLSQVYFNLQREDEALAVMALAYRNGLLDQSSELLFLADLYAYANLPRKAAEVLAKGIAAGIVEASESHWTRTADAWYAAAELEQALAGYEQAGAVAADGAIDLRRGYILLDLERWPQARDAVDAALRKGGLDERQTGEAYLLRGMAEFNLDQFDNAGADWDRASRYPPSRDAARQWLNHLREERRRRAS